MEQLPATIGRFQIREQLGQGAFGTVYRAFDPQLGREVALKVPLQGTLDNPKARERFLREAKAAGRLQHPHIVPVYEVGQDDNIPYDNIPYIAAAFVNGQTLADLAEEKPLDFREAAKVVHALAQALAYAHEQGIVHRDVKPRNVLIDRRGQVLLTDFGVAHLPDASRRLTRLGQLLGSTLSKNYLRTWVKVQGGK
jgi:serine/threonine protein kinase